MKHTINEAYLENIAKAAYEVNINVNVDRPWDHLYPDDKERWRQCGEAAIMAFLHPIMPTIQNAINAVTGAYPGSQQILMMLDEILQMRVGLGLQSQIDVPLERPRLTLVPKVEVDINHKKQELLQDPIVHEAYVLQAQHNEIVDDYYKYHKERNRVPNEYYFKIDIEYHDGQWLVGTAVSDNVWASTPEELMKAVKDQIEYIDTHQDEIKQLLGGHD